MRLATPFRRERAGQRHSAAIGTGGELLLSTNGEPLAVYSEAAVAAEAEELPDGDPVAPFKHDVAFCSPPIHGAVEARRVYEWLEYHASAGVRYFVLYDAGGVDGAVMRVLAPYLERGVMELVNATRAALFETWSHSRGPLMHACLHRLVYSAKWVVFMDFDEYFSTAVPLLTFSQLLDPYEGKPWVSLGSLWWSVEQCLHMGGSQGAWPVERMLYHWPSAYCTSKKKYSRSEMCLEHYGHRKVVVNPRLVSLLNFHMVVDPEEGGVDLNATVARNNHYPGLLRRQGVLIS